MEGHCIAMATGLGAPPGPALGSHQRHSAPSCRLELRDTRRRDFPSSKARSWWQFTGTDKKVLTYVTEIPSATRRQCAALQCWDTDLFAALIRFCNISLGKQTHFQNPIIMHDSVFQCSPRDNQTQVWEQLSVGFHWRWGCTAPQAAWPGQSSERSVLLQPPARQTRAQAGLHRLTAKDFLLLSEA